MNVCFNIRAIEALVAVYVEDHILVLRWLHEAQILTVGAKTVVEDDRHTLRRTVSANRVVRAQIICLKQCRGHVPPRLIEQLNAVKGRCGAVSPGKTAQYIDRMRQIFFACVPFADILDAAVVKTVLAAGSRMEIDDNGNAERLCPFESAVQNIDAAFDKRMRVWAVFAVIRIWRAENPVPDRNANGIDANAGKPGEIRAGDEMFPVVAKPHRCIPAKLRTPGGLIRCRKPIEQARRHPFFQQQPAAQIDAAEMGGWV